MKKLLMICSLVAVTVAWLAVSNAAQHRAQSFLNGPWVNLTNNTTVLNATTNVLYTNSSGSLVLSTNVGAFNDVIGFSDLNGNPASMSVTAKWSASSTNVLTFTFVRSGNGTDFDTNVDAGVKSWSFATPTTSGSLNGQTLTTNLPAWFVTAAAKIRLFAIVASDVNNSTNIALTALTLNGFVP